MDTSVSTTNSRENELQFDISVEGTDVSEMRARFVIKTDDVNYTFDCKQGDEAAKWVVKIPALPQLKSGTYDFYVEIITNGYYFDPYKGKVEVTPEPTVSQSDVKTKKPSVPVVKPIVVKSKKPEEEQEEKDSSVVSEETEDDRNKNLVDAFLRNKKKKPIVKVSKQDKAVRDALKEFKDERVEVKSSRPAKRKLDTKIVPKKREIKQQVNEDNRSTLESVIADIGVPTDEQAKKVHDIIKSVNEGKE